MKRRPPCGRGPGWRPAPHVLWSASAMQGRSCIREAGGRGACRRPHACRPARAEREASRPWGLARSRSRSGAQASGACEEKNLFMPAGLSAGPPVVNDGANGPPKAQLGHSKGAKRERPQVLAAKACLRTDGPARPLLEEVFLCTFYEKLVFLSCMSQFVQERQ